MKKVGVTGGAGFIGTYVVEELQRKGYTPVIFDHHKRNDAGEGVELFLGDVRDPVAMTEFAAHVDGVIHLAAVLGTQETVQNPRPAALSNLEGGLNFLEAVAQYNIPGTYIAVGNWWMNNPYSITKNMIERFVYMFNTDRNTRVNIVRAVNAYGPRQLAAVPFAHGKVRKIIPSFACRVLSELPIEIYGDGEQVSDMVYVADVARALVLALEEAERGNVFDRAVEVGDGSHKTVNEIAQSVIDAAVDQGYRPVSVKHLPMRPGEVPGAVVVAEPETLSLIGLTAAGLVPLETGMAQTVTYYHQTRGTAWEIPGEL